MDEALKRATRAHGRYSCADENSEALLCIFVAYSTICMSTGNPTLVDAGLAPGAVVQRSTK